MLQTFWKLQEKFFYSIIANHLALLHTIIQAMAYIEFIYMLPAECKDVHFNVTYIYIPDFHTTLVITYCRKATPSHAIRADEAVILSS